MKNILIILAFFSLSISAQNNKLWLYNGNTVIFQNKTTTYTPFDYYYSFNGTSSYGEVADTFLFDNPNLVLNPGFEVFTGIADDEISDNWDTWVESSKLTDSTHLAISTTAHGSYELKMNHTEDPLRTPSMYQNITVEENTEYILRFKYKCNVFGRYRIYDNSNAADIVPTKVVDDTTTQLNYLCQQEPFITPSGCTSIRIYLYTAGSASFFTVDEVVLSLPYSFSVAFWLKRNIDSVNIDRDYFANHFSADNGTGNQQRAWTVRSLGDFSAEGDRGKLNFAVSKYGSSVTQFINSSFELTPYKWYHVVCTQEYLTLGTSNLKIYIDGVLDNENLSVPGYAFNGTAPFTIADINPAPFHPSECDMSNVVYSKNVFTLSEAQSLYNGGNVSNVLMQYTKTGSSNTLWIDEKSNLNAIMNNCILTE